MTGSGTQADPYIIEDVTDLQDIESDLTAYYELGNDIDASATVGWNGGLGFLTLGGWTGTPFTGQLDGKGYKITDLFFSVIGVPRYAGLFYEIDADSTVQNLGIVDVDISSQNYCGAFGRRNDGKITNCYSTGVMVSEAPDCGGLIQENQGTISKCYSTVDIDAAVGGGAGGLVGENYGTISDCYARGDVDAGAGTAGGLVTDNVGALTNCYSTGLVIAGTPGGLVGAGTAAFAVNCFWDTETSGQAASDGGTGKTTAQMKAIETFQSAGWAISRIWNLVEICNNGYPCLIGVNICCPASMPPLDQTIVGDKVSLEAIRNLEFVYGGRAYISKTGNFVYESRYHRNV